VQHVRLKGVAKVTARLAGGRRETYWYAWRGGPRLEGKPGTPEFVASYARAHEKRTQPRTGTLAGLVALYKASPEWRSNAESTKREWGRWLDRICEVDGALAIGDFDVAALNDPDVREDLLAWRDQWADRPRSADYAIQVLSRVLSWCVDRRKLKINAAERTEDLYVNNRADQIWTEDELAMCLMGADSPESGFVLALDCLTGLRREDLASLCWEHVGDVAIVMPTHKSGGAETATVPLLAETQRLLEEIKAHQARRQDEIRAAASRKGRPVPNFPSNVLTNTRAAAWTPSGLSHAVIEMRRPFGITKRLHDGRGTFGTRLRHAGLTAPEIADILGWAEDRVVRLLATYIDRDAIVRAIADRIARNESRT
jgi:integrase